MGFHNFFEVLESSSECWPYQENLPFLLSKKESLKLSGDRPEQVMQVLSLPSNLVFSLSHPLSLSLSLYLPTYLCTPNVFNVIMLVRWIHLFDKVINNFSKDNKSEKPLPSSYKKGNSRIANNKLQLRVKNLKWTYSLTEEDMLHVHKYYK